VITVVEVSEKEKELQRQKDKFFKEMIQAKARVYDLTYGEGAPEPKAAELKSKIVSQERDIENLVKIKDDLLEKNGALRNKILELEAKVKELQVGK
jgi:chromosome segregation ATPase